MRDFQVPLNLFFSAAAEICDEVLDFQPDLVMGLMHSGSLPLYAGMELWKRTQNAAFPPVVKVNLGREKLARFDALEERPGVSNVFIGEYESVEGIAFFLAWLSEQSQWQQELQEMVQEVTGDIQPQRILVVDEFIHEGSTYFLTLGLLNLVYPTAEARFYNADIEFKHDFLVEWARRFHPDLLATELFPSKEYLMATGPYADTATHMVFGTEDINTESLRWKTADPTSAALQDLQVYLPVSDWLGLPEFSHQVVLDEITAHIKEYVPRPRKTKDRYPHLTPGHLILREIYRHGPLTLREFSKHLGWSSCRTRYQVDQQIGFGSLVSQKQKDGYRYEFSPRLKQGYWSQDRPLLETYWVIPDRLLAGELPGFELEYEKESLPARLQWLLDNGVTYFIDLSCHYQYRPETYERRLMEMAAEQKKEIHYVGFPTPMRRLPSRGKIQSILRDLDQAIQLGHLVYIHDHSSHVTEAIVGCYLVRHGMTGTDAIKELERVRQNTREGWMRSPAKENARRLIRGWR